MNRLLAMLLLGLCRVAAAQSASATADGTSFGMSIAPSSASQVVNPAAVSPSTWGTSASTPTAVPGGLGAFSLPNTSSSNLSSARAIGLGGFGDQAINQCANFIPTATSDPLQIQACAAVNFLTNRCMTPNSTQAGVIANLGMSAPTSPNCANTYGQSVQNFNMSSLVTDADPIFSVPNGLKSNASSATGETCTPETVVLDPPRNELHNCVKDATTSPHACSQYLNFTVTPPAGCAAGSTLVNTSVYRTGAPPDTVDIKATCAPSAGATAIPFNFNAYGLRGSCAPALTVNIDMSQPQPRGTNPPPVLGQVTPHWLYACRQMAVVWTGAGCPACSGASCRGLTCSATFHIVSWPGVVRTRTGGWTWASGIHLQQNVTFPVPADIPATVTTSWADGCTPFEASAGITLPRP